MQGCRHGEINIFVIHEGLVDISQTWWKLAALIYREAHTHGLVHINVGVLTYDDHFDVFDGGLSISIENQGSWWVTRGAFIFFLNELVEHSERG